MVRLLPAAVTAAGDPFLADCVTGAVETMLMVQRTVHILAVGMVPVAAGMGTVLVVQSTVRFQTMAVVQSAAGMDTMLMIQSTVGQAVVMIQGTAGIKAVLMVQGTICLAMDMIQGAGGEGSLNLCLRRHRGHRKKPGRRHQEQSSHRLPKKSHQNNLP